MRESFSESTEAITHDSDPKYLSFERVSDNPAKQSGEGTVLYQVGTELDLSTMETGDTPAVIGPRVGDLTGGAGGGGGPETVTFDMLIGGGSTYTIHYTDTTINTFSLDYNSLKALADAQLHGGSSSAIIDLTARFDISTAAGKTIDHVENLCAFNWVSSNPTGLNTTTGFSFIGPMTMNTQFGAAVSSATDMSEGSYTDTGPGLGVVVGLTDKLVLNVVLAGNNALSSPNYVTLQLRPPVTNDDLSAGIVQVRFTLDDASVVGPFEIAASDLTAFADANSLGGVQSISPLSTDLSWDTSGIVGHSIVSIEFTVTEPYASSPGFGGGSTIRINTGPTNITYADLNALGDFTNAFVAGPFSSAPVFTILGTWIADPGTIVNLQCNVDAASVLSFASGGQLTTQSNVIDMYNTELVTNYLGWFMGGIVSSNMVNNYGSSHTPTIQAPSQFRLGFSSGGSGSLFGTFDPLNVAGTWSPGSVQTNIAADARLQIGLELYPKDTPATFGGKILTVPYELKNRNLTAFKFHIFEAGGVPVTGDGPFPTFDVVMFVSQGTPKDNDSNFREWANIPINFTTNTSSFIDNQIASIPVDEGYSGLPNNFGGSIVIPSNNFQGPWNYVRFYISPSDGFHNDDYTGMILTITANARELR